MLLSVPLACLSWPGSIRLDQVPSCDRAHPSGVIVVTHRSGTDLLPLRPHDSILLRLLVSAGAVGSSSISRTDVRANVPRCSLPCCSSSTLHSAARILACVSSRVRYERALTMVIAPWCATDLTMRRPTWRGGAGLMRPEHNRRCKPQACRHTAAMNSTAAAVTVAVATETRVPGHGPAHALLESHTFRQRGARHEHTQGVAGVQCGRYVVGRPGISMTGRISTVP